MANKILNCLLLPYLLEGTEWPREIPQIQVELPSWQTVAHHDRLSPET